MNKNTLKEFLNLDGKSKAYDLNLDNCKNNEYDITKKQIKQLFDIALEDKFILYFDGVPVDDPYDGLEFKTLEEEFYFNNGNSYLVFRDEEGTEVLFKIKCLKEYDFEKVYKVTEKAVIYTQSNSQISKYKFY